jgi:hypothetical protein
VFSLEAATLSLLDMLLILAFSNTSASCKIHNYYFIFVIVIEWMLIWIIYRLRRIIFGTVFYFFLDWLIVIVCSAKQQLLKVMLKLYFFWESKIDQYLFYCSVTDLCIKQRRRVCCKDERMENTYLVTVTSTTWQPVTFVWTSIDSIYIQLILKVNWIKFFWKFIPWLQTDSLKIT